LAQNEPFLTQKAAFSPDFAYSNGKRFQANIREAMAGWQWAEEQKATDRSFTR
jgi:hypothetical protein